MTTFQIMPTSTRGPWAVHVDGLPVAAMFFNGKPVEGAPGRNSPDKLAKSLTSLAILGTIKPVVGDNVTDAYGRQWFIYTAEGLLFQHGPEIARVAAVKLEQGMTVGGFIPASAPALETEEVA